MLNWSSGCRWCFSGVWTRWPRGWHRPSIAWRLFLLYCNSLATVTARDTVTERERCTSTMTGQFRNVELLLLSTATKKLSATGTKRHSHGSGETQQQSSRITIPTSPQRYVEFRANFFIKLSIAGQKKSPEKVRRRASRNYHWRVRTTLLRALPPPRIVFAYEILGYHYFPSTYFWYPKGNQPRAVHLAYMCAHSNHARRLN